MEIKNKKIVIASGSIMIIIMLMGLTYAYWTREFKQSGINENIYECFNITFKEEKSGISLENAYPQTDEEGIKNEAYRVDIENTCPTITSYNVVLNKIKTSTLEDSHVKIAVNNDIKLLSETENTESRIENASEGKIIKTGVLAKGDKKELEIRSWMEESTSEEEGTNKNFTYKITIEAVAGGKNLLAAKILTNNTLRTETPDFKKGLPNNDQMSEEITNLSGLYKAQDDDGDSYYFRGAVKNNYVNFADQLWQILRINGDGTIRLVKTEDIGPTTYTNYEKIEPKYLGYTYDNAHNCTKTNPCTKEDGTSSIAKTFLEKWYNDNLSNYDNYIALGSFCNDTSPLVDENLRENYGCTESECQIYGSSARISPDDFFNNPPGVSPTLTCSNTNENYGGYYKLKIGMLTADEIIMAGMGKTSSSTTETNYLTKSHHNYSMTPYSADQEHIYIYGCFTNYLTTWYDSQLKTAKNKYVTPVINLKPDIKITSGDGTKENPFIIT